MPAGMQSRTKLILALTILVAGCNSDDARLVEVTREASNRQAEQNQQIARQNQQLAEATKSLVQADAEARKELAALERQLQAERALVGKQRDELERERRRIAQERYWDSVLGTAVGSATVLLAVLLPLVLCWYLLHGLRAHGDEQAIGELLTMELIGDSPTLLPSAEQFADERQLPPFEDGRDGEEGESAA